MNAARGGRSATAPHAIGNAATQRAGCGSDTAQSSDWLGERRFAGGDAARAQRDRGVAVNIKPSALRRGQAKESKRGQQ